MFSSRLAQQCERNKRRKKRRKIERKEENCLFGNFGNRDYTNLENSDPFRMSLAIPVVFRIVISQIRN